MKENSRIRFNPVTKEIEIEGSESFVKTYFKKIQEMVSGPAEKPLKAKKAGKKVTATKASSATKARKEPKTAKTNPQKEGKKATERAPGVRRVTNIDMIIGLIQSSTEGISTSELKGKTGLAESQIWNIVNRAAKLGKIKKVRRGVYGAVSIQ